MGRNRKRHGVTLFLALGILLTALPLAEERREELVKRGEFLFGIYCSSCHGKSARGNGPLAAEMTSSPPDLTVLSHNNEGVFPFVQVYDTIDGRSDIRSHSEREMPVWGLAFQELDKDTDQRDEVRGRILQLIYFLESVQVEEKEKKEK